MVWFRFGVASGEQPVDDLGETEAGLGARDGPRCRAKRSEARQMIADVRDADRVSEERERGRVVR